MRVAAGTRGRRRALVTLLVVLGLSACADDPPSAADVRRDLTDRFGLEPAAAECVSEHLPSILEDDRVERLLDEGLLGLSPPERSLYVQILVPCMTSAG